MGLKYVVLTSVNRDDLSDGGAAHYAAAVRAIKRRTPATAVEALTPDFQGVMRDVRTVLDSGLDVFAQNVETVERLTHPVRDPRAGYAQTIEVLRAAKLHRPSILTKTSLMLGLGESDAEIRQTIRDLRAAVRFSGMRVRAVGAIQLPRGTGAGPQQCRPRQCQARRRWWLVR